MSVLKFTICYSSLTTISYVGIQFVVIIPLKSFLKQKDLQKWHKKYITIQLSITCIIL